MGSPNTGQSAFSHVDGPPGISGGRALTPHESQIGEASSSVLSHRSLMTTVSQWSGDLRRGSYVICAADGPGNSDSSEPDAHAERVFETDQVVDIARDNEVASGRGADHNGCIDDI